MPRSYRQRMTVFQFSHELKRFKKFKKFKRFKRFKKFKRFKRFKPLPILRS